MDIAVIPHINAVLNALTVVLLWMARGYAKSGNTPAHKKTMVITLAVSALFLALYVTYHLGGGFAKFGGEGLVRWIYFPILIIHVIGAVAIVPLVPMAVYFAVKDQRERHKQIVKFTWPLWFFVAVSGVVVYVMAQHLWPCEGACLLSGITMPSR
jgi:putative membrane protein